MMTKIIRLAVIGTLCFLAAFLSPRPTLGNESQEKYDVSYKQDYDVAYKQAYNLVLQEKWAEALKAMEELVIKYSKSAWVDDARFWQCYAREKLNKSPATVYKCYQEFINAYPESEWADDARANMVRLGRELAKMGKPEYEAMITALEGDQEADG